MACLTLHHSDISTWAIFGHLLETRKESYCPVDAGGSEAASNPSIWNGAVQAAAAGEELNIGMPYKASVLTD